MAILPEQKKGVVLLVNANHLMMDKMTFTEFGEDVAKMLAGERSIPNRFGAVVPWALRGLPLIPVLQIVGVAATLRRLLRWHRDPSSHPLGGRKWGTLCTAYADPRPASFLASSWSAVDRHSRRAPSGHAGKRLPQDYVALHA